MEDFMKPYVYSIAKSERRLRKLVKSSAKDQKVRQNNGCESCTNNCNINIMGQLGHDPQSEYAGEEK